MRHRRIFSLKPLQNPQKPRKFPHPTMTSFFYQTAQSLINQYPDRFPLLKITHLLDWQAIEVKLQKKSPPLRQQRQTRLCPTAHVPRHITRTMAQPIRLRTRTQFQLPPSV